MRPDAASLNVSGGRNQNESVTLTIGPDGGVFDLVFQQTGRVPAYTLSVPAGALCAQLVGQDGCTPAAGSVTVTATLHHVVGHIGVDFSPELKFGNGATIGTMRDAKLVFAMERRPSAKQDWSVFNILYTPDGFQTIINDGATDPSVATHVDLTSGFVWRSVKHFSGYVAVSGSCDPTVDPTCADSTAILQQ